MKKFVSIIAYIWAGCCMILLLAVFMNNHQFSLMLGKLPCMKLNPVYTGGNVIYTQKKDSLSIQIHEPVFEALIGRPQTGFVQVDFLPEGKLPEYIHQDIDYNNDGSADFAVDINTNNGETGFTATDGSCVRGLSVSTQVKDHWMIRVTLCNPDVKSGSCNSCPYSSKKPMPSSMSTSLTE